MALNPALRQLIQDKLAHTRAPQWALPIAEVRQAFRNLWTPAITGEPAPIRHQVLLQPVVDFTLSFPSIALPNTECLVPREDLAWYYRTYGGDRCNPRDPRVSPIFADDLSGLPAALIIAAEYDTLRDEA